MSRSRRGSPGPGTACSAASYSAPTCAHQHSPLVYVSHLRKGPQILHLVQRSAHGDLQQHAIIRHAPLLVVVDIVLAPLADDAEGLHVVGEVARHERVQSHGERAATAVPLRPALDIAYLRVRPQRDLLVQPRKRHVVEEARGARDAREVGDIVELARSACDDVARDRTHMCEDELDEMQRKLFRLGGIWVRPRRRREPRVNGRRQGLVEGCARSWCRIVRGRAAGTRGGHRRSQRWNTDSRRELLHSKPGSARSTDMAKSLAGAASVYNITRAPRNPQPPSSASGIGPFGARRLDGSTACIDAERMTEISDFQMSRS
jgi:hypothetical protein